MWSSVAVRNGSDGCSRYSGLPRTMWMSVVSLARAAGVTWLFVEQPLVDRQHARWCWPT